MIMENNCSNISSDELLMVNLTISITAAVCTTILFTITISLFLCKQFNTLLKRLFLYVMIAATTRGLFLTASIERHFQNRTDGEEVCSSIAYFYDWTGLVLGVFIVGLTLYLLCLVCSLIKGNLTTRAKFLKSSRNKTILEMFYVILTFSFTFLYAIIPYITDSYGLANAWCWIKIIDENCQMMTSGLIEQFSHGYLFFFTGGLVAFILTLAMAFIYRQLPSTLFEARLLLKRTSILLVCILLRILVILTAFISEMLDPRLRSKQQLFALWMVIAILYPVSLLLYPCGYLFSFYHEIIYHGLSKMKAKLKVCCIWVLKHTQRKKQGTNSVPTPLVESIRAPTFAKSTRLSLPSHTYFNVPYTDQFTDLSSDGALLINGGRLYGSIV